MPNVEDQIDWKAQMDSLPTVVRAAIVWFRVIGLVGLVIVLVGINMGRELGLFEDQATQDRKSIMTSAVEQQRILHENQVILQRQLEITEHHAKNTEAISRNLCMMIPAISDREKRSCVNGEKW